MHFILLFNKQFHFDRPASLIHDTALKSVGNARQSCQSLVFAALGIFSGFPHYPVFGHSKEENKPECT